MLKTFVQKFAYSNPLLKPTSRQASLRSFCQVNFYSDSVLTGYTAEKDTPEYKKNLEDNAAVHAEFDRVHSGILNPYSEKDLAKNKKRNKLPARERINKVLDPGSPFLELSQ